MAKKTEEQDRLEAILGRTGLPGFGSTCPENLEEAETLFDIVFPEDETLDAIVNRHTSSLPDWTDCGGTHHEGLDTPTFRNAFETATLTALEALLLDYNGDVGEVCEVIADFSHSDAVEEEDDRLGEFDGTMLMLFLAVLEDAADAVRRACPRASLSATLACVVGDRAELLEDYLTWLDRRSGERYLKPLSEATDWEVFNSLVRSAIFA